MNERQRREAQIVIERAIKMQDRDIVIYLNGSNSQDVAVKTLRNLRREHSQADIEFMMVGVYDTREGRGFCPQTAMEDIEQAHIDMEKLNLCLDGTDPRIPKKVCPYRPRMGDWQTRFAFRMP